MEKVVIVGAGPAGLFAAYDLTDDFEVTIIERRGFVGGSGLHSDGKLNFHPHIGGGLTALCLFIDFLRVYQFLLLRLIFLDFSHWAGIRLSMGSTLGKFGDSIPVVS